jgi:hypothetical protein
MFAADLLAADMFAIARMGGSWMSDNITAGLSSERMVDVSTAPWR